MSDAASPLDPEQLLAHRGWIRGLARQLVSDEGTAEDLVQETLRTALERPPPIVRSVRGWLRSVLRSRAVDHHRSESRRVQREAMRPRREAVPSTADLVARADAQRAVAAAVMRLEEPYKTTVLLRYFEELSPAEIAARTGEPRETVKSRLRRAHLLLRLRLDDEFGGGRRRWALALLPLLAPTPPAPPVPAPSPTAASTTSAGTAALSTGVLAVSTKTKIAVVAAVIALLAGGVAWTVGTSQRGDSTGDGASLAGTPTEPSGAVAASATAAPRSARGVVRRIDDGAPVTGAEVRIRAGRAGEQSVTTDADGTFELTGLPSAVAWDLSIRATGLHPLDTALSPVAGESDVGTLWLASATQLTVEVNDAAGAPVSGALVRVRRARGRRGRAHVDSYLEATTDAHVEIAEEREARTDGRGEAMFADIAAGHWRVRAERADPRSVGYASLSVESGAARERVTVRLSATWPLSGRLVDDAGTPLPGVTVSTYDGFRDDDGRSTLTDADGEFELVDLEHGRLSLHAGGERGLGLELASVLIPDVPWIELVMPARGSIAGRVTDVAGSPLAGIDVRFEVSRGMPRTCVAATTNSDGRYAIEAVPEGFVSRVRVFHDDYVQLWPRIVVGSLVYPEGTRENQSGRRVVWGGETAEIDIVLTRGARLTGSVVGPDGPVASAEVYRWRKPTRAGQDWASTLTGADGRFAFPPQLPGAVALEVRHAGYYQTDLPLDVSRALAKDEVPKQYLVEIPESGEVVADLRVAAGVPVHGRVLDTDGRGVSGAAVDLVGLGWSRPAPPTAVTQDDGSFVFPRVRPGKGVALVASAPGWVSADIVKVDVAGSGPVQHVEIALVRAPSLRFDVLSHDGGPAAAAEIEVTLRAAESELGYVPPSRLVTDTDGRAELELPYAACAVSYSVRSGEVARTSGTLTVSVEEPLESPVVIRLGEANLLSGQVVYATDGAVATGVRVALLRPGTTPAFSGGRLLRAYGQDTTTLAVTDENGEFHIPAGARGERYLLLEGRSVAETVVPVTIPAGGQIRIDVSPALAISGTVTGRDGAPVARAMVVCQPRTPGGTMQVFDPSRGTVTFGGGMRAVTDDEGRFTVAGLAAGEYAVEVFPKEPAYGSFQTGTTFGPYSAGRSGLALALDRPVGATLRGRVVVPGGSSFVHASVRYEPEVGDALHSRLVTADISDGRFVIHGLPYPAYTLTIRAGGPSPRERVFRGVEPGGDEIDFVLEPGATISGVVVDENGRPLASWPIEARRAERLGRTRFYNAVTDETGRFELRDLEETPYELQVAPTGAAGSRRSLARVTAEAGATDVRLVAVLGARIAGVVVDDTGAPVPELRLYFSEPPRAAGGGTVPHATTDENGVFEITGLRPEDTYEIRPEYGREHWQMGWELRQSVPAGSTDVRLVFPQKPEE